jgi:hypothetical protein
MEQVCSSCHFYRGGECHKAPPVRLPRKFDETATAGNRVRVEEHIWGWPQVPEDGWCGEHQMAVFQPKTGYAANLQIHPGE